MYQVFEDMLVGQTHLTMDLYNPKLKGKDRTVLENTLRPGLKKQGLWKKYQEDWKQIKDKKIAKKTTNLNAVAARPADVSDLKALAYQKSREGMIRSNSMPATVTPIVLAQPPLASVPETSAKTEKTTVLTASVLEKVWAFNM